MRRINFLLISALALVTATLHYTNGQIQSKNTVPDTITACYVNTTAYNRFTRQPMHIENLIAIIRKIETKTNGQWDARRIARTLIHRFMFDGMEYSSGAKAELAFRQKPRELAKSLIIKELIPIPAEEILPDYILDNDEKCALHWMLSHSMNATMRDDENMPGFGYPSPGYGSGNGNYPNSNGGANPNPFNPTNGFPNPGSNGNPSMGNSYSGYNRWKRDVSEANQESNDTWNLSREKSSQKEDSQENENKDYDAGTSSEDRDDYDEASRNETSENHNNTEIDLPHDDEVDYLHNVSSGSTAKSGRQMVVQEQDPKKRTRRPIESGVVYTKWGAVSAGRLISGIAAGLEPTTMSVTGSGVVYKPESSYGGTNPWSGGSGLGNSGNGNTPWKSTNGGQYPGQQQPQYPGQQPQYPGQPPQGSQQWGRKKRQIPSQNLTPLESLYAATLSGDAGQAAILNAQYEMGNALVPSGIFNDSVCPREYIVGEHSDPSKEISKDSHAWTYLTEAEIRGGVDGIILGSNIRRWDPSYTLRLSDILSQYYSENGIAGEPQFRSCDRSNLLSQAVDANKLRDQTRSFASLYNNRTSTISDQTISLSPNLFETLVNEAYQRMQGVASSFSSSGRGCTRQGGNPISDQNDNQKIITPKVTVYGVIDHSATIPEIEQQKRFLGELAYELNVSPAGSRLGVVDGNSGTVLISPNWTDVSSVLACRILSLPSQMKTQDYPRALTGMRTELEKVRTEELRYNYTTQNGVVVLLMVQGRRLDEGQRNEIIRIRDEINRDVYGDVTVVATSTKYPDSDFDGLRFIKIQQGGQNFSDFADEFAQSLVRNTHGSLRYLYCNSFRYSQENEHKEATHLFITPGTIEYFKISPEYFFSARSMILRFTSDNGRARVCISRKEWYPNANNDGSNGVKCAETSGNYVVPGHNTVDAEFRDGFLHKPCGKHGKLEGCDPIYVSITPIQFPSPGQVGLDCSIEGCQSSNQVKVTFTHWDMRCNGAIRTLLSSTIAIIAASIALLNWMKTT